MVKLKNLWQFKFKKKKRAERGNLLEILLNARVLFF